MKNLLIQVQSDTTAAIDTLTKSYSQKWEAMSGMDSASPLIKTAASYDLMFIVLGVSLIIWFVLLFFVVRLDKKVSKLEQKVTQEKTDEVHEA